MTQENTQVFNGTQDPRFNVLVRKANRRNRRNRGTNPGTNPACGNAADVAAFLARVARVEKVTGTLAGTMAAALAKAGDTEGAAHVLRVQRGREGAVTAWINRNSRA